MPSNVQRSAHLVYFGGWLALIGLPLAAIAALVVLGPSGLALEIWDGVAIRGTPQGLPLWSALTIWALGIGLYAFVIGHVISTGNRFRKGEMLSRDVARGVIRIGQGMFAIALFSLLSYPALTILLTWANPVGERSVAVALDHTTVWFLVAGVLIVLIEQALQAGVIAQEENRSFV